MKLSVVFAVYKEHHRILRPEEHDSGEDFLRRKVAQLNWLASSSPKFSWELVAVDDGCPEGSGRGGPGYRFEDEIEPSLRHDRGGVLSMANAGPGTDGSQFFLTFTPTPHLDDNHTIYGEVTEGQPVLEELEKRGSGGGATSEPLHMIKTTIEFDS